MHPIPRRAAFAAIVVLTLTGARAWAHGEDRPGKHGGSIRMPGAFHTEVIAPAERRFEIFLLDMAFDQPTTEGSSVNAKLQPSGGGAPRSLSCSPEASRFVCVLPTGQNWKAGDKLVVTAVRQGARGGDAVYDLPLRFDGKRQPSAPRQSGSSGKNHGHGHHHP